MKTLLITGGSSGIGKSTADLFAQKGYKVFELSRSGESREGVTHIYCDVVNPDDCKKAVAEVISKCGKIDVMISNAGMGISGAIEFTDICDVRRQMDVNFYGCVNITQAVLPHMRKAGRGRMVFVSSMAGIFAIPFQGFYSVSKFAVMAFAAALKNEVRPFGISVTCMLPGDVKTGFTAARKKSDVGSDIYTNMKSSVETMEKDEMNGIEPIKIARKIMKISESKSPAIYNTTGLIYHIFILLNKILPATFAYRIVGMMYTGK